MIGAGVAARRPGPRSPLPRARGARRRRGCDRWTSITRSSCPSDVDRGVDPDPAPPRPERRPAERGRSSRRRGGAASARRAPRAGWTTGQCLNAHRRSTASTAPPPGRRRGAAGPPAGRRRPARRRGRSPATASTSTPMGALHVPGQHRRLEHGAQRWQIGCATRRVPSARWPTCPASCTRSPSPARADFTVIARGEGALVWDAERARVRRRHGQPVVLRRRSRARRRSPTPSPRSSRRSPRTRASSRSPTDRPTSSPSGWSRSPRSPTPGCSSAARGPRPSTRRSSWPASPTSSPATPSARWSSAASAATTAPTSAARAPRASRLNSRGGGRSSRRSCRCRATTPRRSPC